VATIRDGLGRNDTDKGSGNLETDNPIDVIGSMANRVGISKSRMKNLIQESEGGKHRLKKGVFN